MRGRADTPGRRAEPQGPRSLSREHLFQYPPPSREMEVEDPRDCGDHVDQPRPLVHDAPRGKVRPEREHPESRAPFVLPPVAHESPTGLAVLRPAMSGQDEKIRPSLRFQPLPELPHQLVGLPDSARVPRPASLVSNVSIIEDQKGEMRPGSLARKECP